MKILKSIINIILILTLPIWLGTFVFFYLIYDVLKRKRSKLSEAIRGEVWLIEI